MSSCSLLQGIFPTQGLNPGLLHCWQIFYQLNYQGSSRVLELVVYPFFSRSSQLRNWTGVFCIAGGFLYQLSYQGSPNTVQDYFPNCSSFIVSFTVCAGSVVSDSFGTPWAVACQAPVCMGFSRQEYWRGLPFPTSGDLPEPGIEPRSLVSPELAGFFTTAPPEKPFNICRIILSVFVNLEWL